MDPKPEDIDLEDIAHALGNICRYTGQVERFYSVAEHSVTCAVDPRAQDDVHRRALLLHDASEAYLGDVISPLKKLMRHHHGKAAHFFGGTDAPPRSCYDLIEDRFNRAIEQRFGLPDGALDGAAVHAIDLSVCMKEQMVLRRLPSDWKPVVEPSSVYIRDADDSDAHNWGYQFLYHANLLGLR
jgi:hypothetical protein